MYNDKEKVFEVILHKVHVYLISSCMWKAESFVVSEAFYFWHWRIFVGYLNIVGCHEKFLLSEKFCEELKNILGDEAFLGA